MICLFLFFRLFYFFYLELPIERESNDAEFNQDFQNRLDSIDLGQKGMDFWVDGFRTNNKKKLDKINKINIHLHGKFNR